MLRSDWIRCSCFHIIVYAVGVQSDTREDSTQTCSVPHAKDPNQTKNLWKMSLFFSKQQQRRKERKKTRCAREKKKKWSENVKFLACLLYRGLCSVWRCTICRLNFNMNTYSLINGDILQKFRRNTFDIWMLELNIANKRFYVLCPHARFIFSLFLYLKGRIFCFSGHV